MSNDIDISLAHRNPLVVDHIRSPCAFYYYGLDELAYMDTLVFPPFLPP